ncbi:hypothetical protein NQ318_008967 [Aromia moschata]|uniref:Zinc finger protein n=1 Tax=Aromia moschata TaxID=1265417 RepID=A0AAV8ZCG0_9CUCU|nr:hypothetical protein NQ318_008967 [Aromia moschata]
MEECELKNICRACLSEEAEFRSVFEPDTNSSVSLQLAEMITSCASVQITLGDGLPDQICSSCAANAVNMYLFKLKCEKSDSVLRERLQKVTAYYEQEFLEKTSDESDKEIIKPELHIESETKLSQNEAILEEFDNFDFGTYKSDCEDYPETVTEEDINNASEVALKHQNKMKEFECDICLKRFSRNDLLIRHKIAHAMKFDDQKLEFEDTFNSEENDGEVVRIKSEEFMFSCSSCDVLFIHKEDLDTHMTCEHDKKEGNIVCEVCSKRFHKMAHLNRHIKTHYSEKAFKCHSCDKGFARQEQLNHHMNVHTGTKPHICDICFKVSAVCCRNVEK